MRRLLLPIAIAVFAACTANKDATNDDGIVVVNGIVRDWRTGAAVPDVQVRTVGLLPEQSTTAAADGTFTLQNVYINGYVIIEVLASGYVRTQSPPILIQQDDIAGLVVEILAQGDVAAFNAEFGITAIATRGSILGAIRRGDGTGIDGVATLDVFPTGFQFDGPHFLDLDRNPDSALAATTSSGTFAFFNVSTGNVAIRASAVGFDFEPEGTVVRSGVWSILAIGGAGNGTTTPTPTPSPTGTPGAQSYSADIVPIFTNRGCNGAGCHRTGSAPAGFRLDLSAAMIYPGVFARVDVGTPVASKILYEPLYEVQADHGGGNIFLNTSDPDYQKILRWVTDGALEN